MGPYKPAESFYLLIEQLKKGREFAWARGQMIADAMMVSKGITLLEQTAMFKEEIIEWRSQTTDQNTWVHIKIFFH